MLITKQPFKNQHAWSQNLEKLPKNVWKRMDFDRHDLNFSWVVKSKQKKVRQNPAVIILSPTSSPNDLFVLVVPLHPACIEFCWFWSPVTGHVRELTATEPCWLGAKAPFCLTPRALTKEVRKSRGVKDGWMVSLAQPQLIYPATFARPINPPFRLPIYSSTKKYRPTQHPAGQR